jgi:hypothetical protein
MVAVAKEAWRSLPTNKMDIITDKPKGEKG